MRTSADLLAFGPFQSGQLQELGQRPLQVALDVVGQGPQRRDVEDVRLIAQLPAQRQVQEAVEAGQERRQCLARAGRGRDQGILPLQDAGPAQPLGFGGRGKAFLEPLPQQGVKGFVWHAVKLCSWCCG